MFQLAATPIDVQLVNESVDWASWASAIGTVVAASVAVGVTLIEEFRRRKAEGERDTAEQRLQALHLAGQALQVHAWVERQQIDPEIPGTGYVTEHDDLKWTVRNGSDEPIFDVKAEIVYSTGPLTIVEETRDVLPPKQSLSGDERNRPATGKRPWVRLYFTDAKGMRWMRAEAGELLPV